MLQFAAVVPHGDEIIEPENEEMRILHESMKKVGDQGKNADLYILISPHNIRIETHIGVILTENLEGEWSSGAIKIKKKLRSDRRISEEIYMRSRDEVPVVGINFGALEGDLSKMPLDWGSLIPLHFLPERETILLTPARGIKKEELVRFGEILGAIIKNEKKRIALLVSADQAHTHSPSGPYGFSSRAREYDEKIIAALKNANLSPLLHMSNEYLEDVKPDSYWQLLILHGVMNVIPMKTELVEYGVADYFGMAVALFHRI